MIRKSEGEEDGNSKGKKLEQIWIRKLGNKGKKELAQITNLVLDS